MGLVNEEEQEKEGKGKKVVIAAIIVTIILIILVLIAIVLLKQTENKTLKLVVNGKSEVIPANFVITDSNDGTSYYSIYQVANLVGYEFYNGEYKKYSEDKNKCYVKCENELAMFELNSDIIYKNSATDKLNFDSYNIDKPITSYNNMLYATAQTIQTAFNARIIYTQSNNTIYIEPLQYLIKYYKSQALKYGYTGIAQDFSTQKAVIQNMLVVEKDKKYGVISTKDFSTIIGNKYDSIIYSESTQEFIVKNEGKTGMLSAEGKTRIGLRYDTIGVIDGQNGIYYAKNDNLYGVLNRNGKILVFIECDSIGINRNVFLMDNIKNNLFLYGNCIPLKKGNKWGIADKNGNIIVNFEYDQLGYVEKAQNSATIKDKSINNVVVITDIEGIVVGKSGKYGVVNSIGKMIIPCEFDKIYSITNEGKDEFYLEKNGKTTKLTKYLNDNKINVEENNSQTNNNSTNKVNNNVTNSITTNTTNNISNKTTNKNNNDSNTTNNKIKKNESIIIM